MPNGLTSDDGSEHRDQEDVVMLSDVCDNRDDVLMV